MTQYAPHTEGGSTTEQVKEQVGEKAQVAQDRARGAAQQARSRLRGQVDQRSTQAGERLSGTASDVRSVAEELHRQGKEAPARMAEQAASRLLKASSSRRYQAAQTSYLTYEEAQPEVGRHLAAEPAVPATDVPVVGTYDPAAPPVTTRVPAGTVPTDPDQRLPRAQ